MPDNEVNELRLIRLPSALLTIGYFFVSIFGSYSIIYLFVAGRIPFFILTGILFGIFSILYGWFKTIRGSSATKQLFKTTRQKIQSGVWAGIGTVILVYLVTRSEGLNISWVVSFLILAITWGLLIGIPAGGIGGLIIASIWKNNKAAFVGGAVAGVIFSLWFFWVNFGPQ